MSATHPPQGEPLVVDGTGMLCAVLLLHLRKQISHAPPATVIHLTTDDPAAPLDLAAWCHLTGHAYLGPVDRAADANTYGLRLATRPRPTRPDSPWHPA